MATYLKICLYIMYNKYIMLGIKDQSMDFKENTLLNKKHILLYNKEQILSSWDKDLNYIKKNFCGNVFTDVITYNNYKCTPDTIIYLCGNIDELFDQINFDNNIKIVNIIKQVSSDYGAVNTHRDNKFYLVNLGEVPINVYNVGVHFRKFFNSDKDYYNKIVNEHQFQSLTESNKPNNALRKGIYLTKVEEENNDEIKYKLLRCSSNFNGPTDNFRDTDNFIINKVNNISQSFFEDNVELNHVLAQTYHNSIEFNGKINKERKAKIKEHSDKTKDMPKTALIAFCSFYKDYLNDNFNDNKLKLVNKSIDDPYDYSYNKNASVLTKLRFRLKKNITDKKLKKNFDVILYPNSVFLISLLTNRLYTHEIIPPKLSVDKIPTRMGYVIRCSNTDVVYKDNKTYIVKDGKYIKLENPTLETIKELRKLYFIENTTIDKVYYDNIYFSLNNGDYTKPLI